MVSLQFPIHFFYVDHISLRKRCLASSTQGKVLLWTRRVKLGQEMGLTPFADEPFTFDGFKKEGAGSAFPTRIKVDTIISQLEKEGFKENQLHQLPTYLTGENLSIYFLCNGGKPLKTRGRSGFVLSCGTPFMTGLWVSSLFSLYSQSSNFKMQEVIFQKNNHMYTC